MMTRIPDLVRVAIVAPKGNSDYPFLSVVISMAQAVPNVYVSRKVFIKHQVNRNTVCGAIQDLPCFNIWLVDNLIGVLNEYLSLLVGRYILRSSVCAKRISLDLMINAGVLLASEVSSSVDP